MNVSHEQFMRECFALAKNSLGRTTPNPYVGSVIVKNNQIVGRGFHQKSGLDHAEVDAIKKTSRENLNGATLYCNLEPCCHTNKKTPPCTKLIISSGIKEVIISNLDPNPEVSGKGIQELEENGIKTISGILKEEGELLNEVFFTHITKKRPFVHLKWAQTLDGKIATESYHSKWITNDDARNEAHKERDLYDAILIGAQTLNSDNPHLTIRLNKESRAKKRVVISSKMGFVENRNLFDDQFKQETIIVTHKENPKHPEIKTLFCQADIKGNLSIPEVLQVLYDEGIRSIYVEGGIKTISRFFDAKIYDRISIFIAPKILGPGISMATGPKKLMSEAINFEQGSIREINKNWIFESKRNVCLQD